MLYNLLEDRGNSVKEFQFTTRNILFGLVAVMATYLWHMTLHLANIEHKNWFIMTLYALHSPFLTLSPAMCCGRYASLDPWLKIVHTNVTTMHESRVPMRRSRQSTCIQYATHTHTHSYTQQTHMYLISVRSGSHWHLCWRFLRFSAAILCRKWIVKGAEPLGFMIY